MLLVAGVEGSVVLLTARRSPRKLLRKRVEQGEVAHPEAKSLEDVLTDAEPTRWRLARRMCEDSGDVHDPAWSRRPCLLDAIAGIHSPSFFLSDWWECCWWVASKGVLCC
jgi:hypothetical protein